MVGLTIHSSIPSCCTNKSKDIGCNYLHGVILQKNTCSTPNIQPPLPRNFGEKRFDTLRELVFLRRIPCFLVGRNHSSQIGDINHNIQKSGSCLTMFNYTFHNRYYQYYKKRFWGYVFPGTKYAYLERKCPLVLIGKAFFWRVQPQNRGQTGSRFVYINIHIQIATCQLFSLPSWHHTFRIPGVHLESTNPPRKGAGWRYLFPGSTGIKG